MVPESPKRLAMNDAPSMRCKNLRRAVFTGARALERYPFYAIPVPELLELGEWKPHQTLLAEGKLRECTEDEDVIFVSHQWLGFHHPDPKGEQLASLQLLLRRLPAGEIEVSSNSTLLTIYGLQMTTHAAEWQRRLPKMLIWLDYFSVPQPEAAAAAGGADGGGELERCTSDHRLAEAVSDVVTQLRGAVDSIPTYIERCSQLWVLAPPCQHLAQWRSNSVRLAQS